jgi:CheY-like chemotaxis protein
MATELLQEGKGLARSTQPMQLPRILLACDLEHETLPMLPALEGLPCQLLVARNGKEALLLIELLSQSGPEAALTLVLLDLHAARPDGADVLKTRRRRKALADIPVVLLTSPEHKRINGVTRYFPKPADPESLIELGQVIQDTLNRRSIATSNGGIPRWNESADNGPLRNLHLDPSRFKQRLESGRSEVEPSTSCSCRES